MLQKLGFDTVEMNLHKTPDGVEQVIAEPSNLRAKATIKLTVWSLAITPSASKKSLVPRPSPTL